MLCVAVGGGFAQLGYNKVGKVLCYHIHTVVVIAEFREIALGFKVGYIAVFIPYGRYTGVFYCRKGVGYSRTP